jgi:hypothetical protein
MLQIENTLVSLDLIEKKFCCHLKKCMGVCCVKGDSGAPLNDEEVKLLPGIIDKIKPFLRPEGIEAIEKQGTHITDSEDEPVTPLVNGEECAYAIFEKGIAKCGIEKAYVAGEVQFRKPVSCHLYPVRVRKYESFLAVNYDKWEICNPARKYGEKVGTPVYEFVKDALIRRFGVEWYNQLQLAAQKISEDKADNGLKA